MFKSKVTILILLALFLSGFSQFAYADQWAKTYGGSSQDFANSIQQTSDGGYIVAGYTESFGAGYSDVWVMKLDSSGDVSWQKTYGGSSGDLANSIRQTSDGGYIVAGHTESFGAGGSDVWVLKLDSSGNVSWQKRYGGSNYDFANSIQQTSDGGYIVAGYTLSFGAGGGDVWILKLDSSGNVTWQKTYGGGSGDSATSIRQTSDGGYIVAAVTDGAGGYDAWVLKLDSSGNVSWQKTYGGSHRDNVRSIQQTSDGGYIVAGETEPGGYYDAWVLKLDSSGNVSWQKTYGGSNGDYARSIQQTSDGGYIVAGYTLSFGAGSEDAWVLKLDSNGQIIGCLAMGSSSITGSNTGITGVITGVTGANTSVSPVTSTAIPANSNAAETEVCYYQEPDPAPDIKANGSDGPLTITSSQSLKLTIALDDGSMAGDNADWWVLCDTSMFGWYHYDLTTWTPGIVVTYQGPLFDLGTYQVMDYVLPAGNYTCYFGVDTIMNSSIDMGQIYYDSVAVTVTP